MLSLLDPPFKQTTCTQDFTKIESMKYLFLQHKLQSS
jgi:hypothetical protein